MGWYLQCLLSLFNIINGTKNIFRVDYHYLEGKRRKINEVNCMKTIRQQ
jgi:hypothetical protein